MKRALHALLAVLTMIVVIAIQAQTGFAQQVVNVARQVTVRVSSSNPGSGVIIGRDNSSYYVLTAYHVIKEDYTNPGNISIVAPDQSEYPVQEIRSLPGATMDLDLAILEFNSTKNYTTVRAGNSDSVDVSYEVWVAGFPTPGGVTTAQQIEVSKGAITGISTTPTSEGYQLIYSNSTAPGVSGGPVLDQNGSLIGIHGKAEARRSFAVPVNIFTRVASGMGISVPSGSSPSSSSPSSSTSGDLASTCRDLKAGYQYWTDKKSELNSACFFDEDPVVCDEENAAAENIRQAEMQWTQLGCSGPIWSLF